MPGPNLQMISSYYSDKLQEYGDCAKGVDWKDESSQKLRYDIFANMMNGPVESLLDFGCGTGGFLTHLLAQDQKIKRYIGIDLADGMRDCVQKKFANRVTVQTHASLAQVQEKVDYAVANGTFLVKLGNDEKAWESYVFETVEKLCGLANKGVIFNLMTTVGLDFRMDHLFYKAPAETLQWALQKHRKVNLDHSYPIYEYTIAIGL